MSPGQTLLLVADECNIAIGVGTLLSRNGFEHARLSCCAAAVDELQAHNPDAIIVDCPDDAAPGGAEALQTLLHEAEEEGICCVVLYDGERSNLGVLSQWAQVASRHASADELWGRLASIWHTGGLLVSTQRQMRDVRRLGEHINREFEEQSRDMRLASCLQQKFLPRDLPDIAGIIFSVVYRPAAWVSGDIYDIARVDEDHISLYIADCVGHGVAASLLTIFVKRAMSSKDIRGSDYTILTPAETLTRLNDALVEADLEMSQYVSAACCLLNIRDYRLQVARAGHPYPLMIDGRGAMTTLKAGGPLLGMGCGQQFENHDVCLEPGCKFILHSDGLEDAFEGGVAGGQEPQFLGVIRELADLGAKPFTDGLNQRLDGAEGSLRPKDDVTVLVAQVPLA